MLAVVGDQVVEGKSVVGGDEVDRVEGLSPVPQVKIARAGYARREIPGRAAVPPPEAANIVAVAVVPFGPAPAGEPAHLVGSSRVPSLGDDLRMPEDRILGDALDDGRVLEEIPRLIPRPSMEPRSKRNPSTCISTTQ